MIFKESLPDSIQNHWSERVFPSWTLPYIRLARLDRPIGWWLLLLPCWWSTALAARNVFPNWQHLVLFLIGAIAMRGAGCTYNDILDKDIDSKVERTALRPIASGQVSTKKALLFLFLLCIIGLLVLLNFNTYTFFLGISSLGIVALYPLMKRFFWAPQLVLGLAFSWGALMGWSATYGNLSAAPICLYLGSIFWTIGYDTIYALQDIEDDEIIGIHSSARFFGSHVRFWTGVSYFCAIVFFASSLVLSHKSLPAFVGLFGLSIHLIWQITILEIKNGQSALRVFRSNRIAGLVFFFFLVIDTLSLRTT